MILRHIGWSGDVSHNDFSIDDLVAKVKSKKIRLTQFGQCGRTSKTFYFNNSPCTIDMCLRIVFNTFERVSQFPIINNIAVDAIPDVQGHYEMNEKIEGYEVADMSFYHAQQQQLGLLIWPGLPSILDSINIQIQNTLGFTPYRVRKNHPSRFPYPRDRYTIRGPPESYHAWQVPRLGPNPMCDIPNEPFNTLYTELHIKHEHAKNICLEDIWKILNHPDIIAKPATVLVRTPEQLLQFNRLTAIIPP